MQNVSFPAAGLYLDVHGMLPSAKTALRDDSNNRTYITQRLFPKIALRDDTNKRGTCITPHFRSKESSVRAQITQALLPGSKAPNWRRTIGPQCVLVWAYLLQYRK